MMALVTIMTTTYVMDKIDRMLVYLRLSILGGMDTGSINYKSNNSRRINVTTNDYIMIIISIIMIIISIPTNYVQIRPLHP